jgi:hypothetical protein
MLLPVINPLLTLLLGAQATLKDKPMGAKYQCPPLGVVYVWRSDAGPRNQKARGIVLFKGKSYRGYWDGGTLQFFTPDLKTQESPWLSYSRTGMPRWELFLGKKSWLVGENGIYKKHTLCSFMP